MGLATTGLSLALLDACTTPAEPAMDGSFYSGDEIAQTIAGNTLSGLYPDGSPWLVYFAANHALRSQGDGPSHSGTWNIAGDQLCFDYPGTADDWCGRFRRDAEQIDIYRNGVFLRQMQKPTVETGNPHSL